MCRNAVATAGDLLTAVEPTLGEFLTIAGVPTNEAATVTTSFGNIVTAVKNWTPGTPITEAEQAINDFNTVFDGISVGAGYQQLAAVISSGILAVLGVLQANEPSNVTLLHAAAVAHTTTKLIQAKVPNMSKLDLRHPEKAGQQYTTEWNKAFNTATGRAV